MKILVINGSAHKGNTWKLVEQAKKQLLECNKEIEFEEVHLIEEKLPFCVGCSNCFRLGHDKCPHCWKNHRKDGVCRWYYSVFNNLQYA